MTPLESSHTNDSSPTGQGGVTARRRPILFSGPMVRAILDGGKTQTRRVINPQPDSNINPVWIEGHDCFQWATLKSRRRCPYGRVGDGLWVRESFSAWFEGVHWYDCDREQRRLMHLSNLYHRADHNFPDDDQKWIPGIFMPRWACRIKLEITEIRAEELQSISLAHMLAEGIDAEQRLGFAVTWDALNARRGFSWRSNPWVWAITFRRIEA